MTIGEVIFNYNEAQEELRSCREALIQKAVEVGLNEKFCNGDHRVAMAYLFGYKGGKGGQDR